ncbi:hypothetical protein FE257_007739 [Aspergillus nanangensis]|uniref:Uncharacterized protein n=1 Tax=Aspergillus nanangensis TaxID=2582783 RepID=A0AAD4GYP9_ASPNN|nr:hypothetical protein FE257_007739 [Aspergillus nanangensis]
MFPTVSAAFARIGIARTMTPPPAEGSESPSNGEEQHAGSSDGRQIFYPDINEVLKVRYILRWKIVAEGLPLEIVDMMMDAAEYWASAEVTLEGRKIIRQDRDQVLVRTWPLCYDPETIGTPSPKLLPHRSIHPCRKILFSISSHDQGGGRPRTTDQYEGSFTWFDTEVVHSAQEADHALETQSVPEPGPNGIRLGPDDPLLLPRRNKLQCNVARSREVQHHQFAWHFLDNIAGDSAAADEIARDQGRGQDTLDGSQVRGLELGDSISVWGRTRFAGWGNWVEESLSALNSSRHDAPSRALRAVAIVLVADLDPLPRLPREIPRLNADDNRARNRPMLDRAKDEPTDELRREAITA